MKTLTVRLPDTLAADIETESRARRVTRSDVVRERLQRRAGLRAPTGVTTLDLIRDLVGSVKGLPSDLSERTSDYLRTRGYGKNRSGRHRVSRRPAEST
jgi:Arc/MetJ-type ribon-helix-helix transcriptional regulator